MQKFLNITQDGQIIYTQHGKPFLKGNMNYFSLSHGGNYSVIAVHKKNIGIDIEKIGYGDAMAARLMFTTDEKAWISGSNTRFYALWTQKESILKADGRGFSLSPNSFSVLSGCAWETDTFFYDNHVITCAAKSPFKIEWELISAKELMGV